MTKKNYLHTFLRFASLAILVGAFVAALPTLHPIHSSRVLAQSADQSGSTELEEFLFVQAPEQHRDFVASAVEPITGVQEP